MEGSKTVLSGLLEFLEDKPGVTDVRVTVNIPVTAGEVTTWEKTNRCVLPEDLKLFYSTHNGLSLTWSYLYNKSIVNLGRIVIGALSHLQPLRCNPSLSDLDDDDDTSWRPSFHETCRAFSLNYCSTCGHTCLVYKVSSQAATLASECSIWLLDLSLTWHPLSSSFSDYLRLAMVHLGLKQWPYALTSNQLSPLYEKWFHVFIPKRLELDINRTAAIVGDDEATFVNPLDVSKLLQSRASRSDRRSKEAKLSQQVSSKKPTGRTPRPQQPALQHQLPTSTTIPASTSATKSQPGHDIHLPHPPYSNPKPV